MGDTINIRQLLELASVHLGVTPEQLLQLVSSGQLANLLSPEQQAQLSTLMRHPEQAESLLSDPEVKAAVRKWQHGQ